MGSDPKKDKNARNNGQPRHKAHLDEYWIGKYPVTKALYGVFIAQTGHLSPVDFAGKNPPKDKLEHSTVNVNWHDVVTFCQFS